MVTVYHAQVERGGCGRGGGGATVAIAVGMTLVIAEEGTTHTFESKCTMISPSV
jgi:hypothetical protein